MSKQQPCFVNLAHSAHGPVVIKIAYTAGISDETVRGYFRGESSHKMHQRVSNALEEIGRPDLVVARVHIQAQRLAELGISSSSKSEVAS